MWIRFKQRKEKRTARLMAILLVGIVALTEIVYAGAGATTWESIPFKNPTESLDDGKNLTYSEKLTQKVLMRISTKKYKGNKNRTNPNKKQPNDNSEFRPSSETGGDYPDLRSQVQADYPGLFDIGTTPVSPNIQSHDAITNKYAAEFGVDPSLMRALMSQECYGGVCDGDGRPAWGPGQIEYTLKNEFKAFGEKYFGKSFQITRNKATDDRLNPEYNIAFACERFSIDLKRYNGDYVKALQAYNYSHYSLNKLLAKFPNGNEWLDQRKNIAHYNGHYKRNGNTRYGDKLYVERVLKFYH